MNTTHPCFDKNASKVYGRIHLPVAPKCNISCNYCNRKFDCVNESRPGVTARVMTPNEALEHLDRMKKIMPHINTIGIAGPGDALANAEKSFATVDTIKSKYPDMHLCLSTNGLNLPDYIYEISYLKISHVTVTVNANSPEIASLIYRRVNYRGVVYRGEEGASVLLQNQESGVQKLIQAGVLVKINFIYIPEINANEMSNVVRMVDKMGANLFNVMPFIPVEKTPFFSLRPPLPHETMRMQQAVKAYSSSISLMDHCQQCRSDAVGLLQGNCATKENDILMEEEATETAGHAVVK
ncbi:MAG: radical SAM protein [Spirochaetia bacterium]|nr:radical SAM protein [Spirochaetia bacterium]